MPVDNRAAPDMYRVFEQMGIMSGEIRSMRELVVSIASNIETRHRENQAQISELRDQNLQIRNDSSIWRDSVTARFDKIERQNEHTERSVDNLTARITEMEPHVKDLAALRTRAGAILAVAASIIGAIWFLLAPLWKFIADWLGRLIIGQH